MEIKDGNAAVGSTLVRPPPTSMPVAGPGDTEDIPSKEAEQAQAALHKLQARAAWFSALVYHHHGGLTDVLKEAGVERFACLEDKSGSTAAFAFVFEGNAWLVFRGSNDWNDWASNVSYLPTWHFGFRRCFAEVVGDIEAWIDGVAGQGHRFCVTGHSLGGALATLAANHLARTKRPVEMLCTFGGPRVFAPWRAEAFDKASANLPDHSGRTLGEVTYRFVDKYELVSHVPLWIAGFKHVGREQPSSAKAGEGGRGRLDDATEAYEEAMQASLIGLHLISLYVAGAGIFRAIAAPKAHRRELYARNIDPEGEYEIAHDAPESHLSKGRLRWSTPLVLLYLGLPRLALAGLLVLLVGWLLFRLFASAPLETLLLGLALAGIVFVGRYLELRKQRGEARPRPPGKYDHILRPK